jgi:MraZ protein
MFGGEFSHSIDVKGRITIPAKFRTELGLECYVTRGFEGCISIYSKEGWEELTKVLLNSQAKPGSSRKLKRQLFSKSTPTTYDSQGRILVSQELRTLAGLTKDVMVIGVGDHVELWDKEKWQEYDYMDDEELATLADEVFAVSK